MYFYQDSHNNIPGVKICPALGVSSFPYKYIATSLKIYCAKKRNFPSVKSLKFNYFRMMKNAKC